jgi:signal transduction histidine kinase
MSATLAVAGWLAALGTATAGRIVLARRMELVARACHELRGPLTAARLAIHLAERPALAGGAPRVGLETIDQELDRAGLALADLSAARHGVRPGERVRSEQVEIGAVLAEAVEAARVAAWTRRVVVRCERPPARAIVHGDGARLVQACANLLANAIEHGGGEVLVRARVGAETVRIEVLDDGPGLPAPIAELVRRPRAGRGARGRGLAIVADIAARHGGRLAAAPSERGARLVLELARAAP